MNHILAILLSLALPALAGTATIAWDTNPEPDIAGYKVYYGTASRTYTEIVDIGNVTTVDLVLSEGVYFLNVTAYNVSGLESDFSEELAFTMPSPAAAWVVEIQASTDLVNWTVIATVPAGAPPYFVRARIKEDNP